MCEKLDFYGNILEVVASRQKMFTLEYLKFSAIKFVKDTNSTKIESVLLSL